MISNHSPLSIPQGHLTLDSVTYFKELLPSCLIINRNALANQEPEVRGWPCLYQNGVCLVQVVKCKANATCECNSEVKD